LLPRSPPPASRRCRHRRRPPEQVRILPTGPAPLSAAIQPIENLGDHAILHLDREQHNGGRVLAKVDRAAAAEGATVGFECSPPSAMCSMAQASPCPAAADRVSSARAASAVPAQAERPVLRANRSGMISSCHLLLHRRPEL
jgi:hypothetical protein